MKEFVVKNWKWLVVAVVAALVAAWYTGTLEKVSNKVTGDKSSSVETLTPDTPGVPSNFNNDESVPAVKKDNFTSGDSENTFKNNDDGVNKNESGTSNSPDDYLHQTN